MWKGANSRRRLRNGLDGWNDDGMADRSIDHLTLGIGLLDGGFRIEVVEVAEVEEVVVEEARTEKEGLPGLPARRTAAAAGRWPVQCTMLEPVGAQAAAGRANGGATRGPRRRTAQWEAMSEYRRRFARYRRYRGATALLRQVAEW